MRIKRSSALVLSFEHDQLLFHNFLAQTTFAANATALSILRRLTSWTDEAALKTTLSGYSSDSIDRALDSLLKVGAVVAHGTPAAAKDEEYQRAWLWGPISAAYHFGAQGETFVPMEDADDMQRSLAKFTPSPPLFQRNPSDAIPAPRQASYGEPFRTMAARRSNRMLLDQPIGLEAVSDAFLFSMAITALIDFEGVGELPLKMTPSGGARNPYEGYVLARRVDGLPAGVYHYSAMERTFARVGEAPPPPFPPLFGDQAWTENAAAALVMAANFDRPMWKYHDPTAYRVTLIEAGHIAQNMILALNAHGLAANPTGLFSTSRMTPLLGLRKMTQAPIYAVLAGHAEPLEDPEKLVRPD